MTLLNLTIAQSNLAGLDSMVFNIQVALKNLSGMVTFDFFYCLIVFLMQVDYQLIQASTIKLTSSKVFKDITDLNNRLDRDFVKTPGKDMQNFCTLL